MKLTAEQKEQFEREGVLFFRACSHPTRHVR